MLKMYSTVIFAFLFANISASIIPENNTRTIDMKNERLFSNVLEQAIQDLSQFIRDIKLDPIYIDQKQIIIALPIPRIFSLEACFQQIYATGFSNIVIHKLSYSIFRSTLDLDFELPLIYFSGATSIKTTVLGKQVQLHKSGRVEIHRVRVASQIRFIYGISGVTIRSVAVRFTLGGIISDLNLVILGKDYSNHANEFIGLTIHNTLIAYSAEIDDFLTNVVINIINANLFSLS